MAFHSNFSISAILGDKVDKIDEIPALVREIRSNSGEIEAIDCINVEDTDPERPQLTYNSLIVMAIKASPEQKLTLSDIYNFIKESFPYYQTCKTQWQNSIRHNLSQSSCFVKIPREYGNPGRGSYWALSPNASDVYIGDDTGRLRYSTQQSSNLLPQQNYYAAAAVSAAMQGIAYNQHQCSNQMCRGPSCAICYANYNANYSVQMQMSQLGQIGQMGQLGQMQKMTQMRQY